ncbi:MAG: hypothetical protein EKK63_01675 [Acinetobacter sp.]|nr:MAG: hypothetical protein EKK63_01675 [Acinetobacter sp.]
MKRSDTGVSELVNLSTVISIRQVSSDASIEVIDLNLINEGFVRFCGKSYRQIHALLLKFNLMRL